MRCLFPGMHNYYASICVYNGFLSMFCLYAWLDLSCQCFFCCFAGVCPMSRGTSVLEWYQSSQGCLAASPAPSLLELYLIQHVCCGRQMIVDCRGTVQCTTTILWAFEPCLCTSYAWPAQLCLAFLLGWPTLRAGVNRSSQGGLVVKGIRESWWGEVLKMRMKRAQHSQEETPKLE